MIRVKRLAVRSAVMFSCGVVVFLECLSQPQRAPLGFTERVNGLLYFFFTSEEEVLFLSAVSALSLYDTQSLQEKTLSARSTTEKQKFGFFKRSTTSNHGGQVTYHTEYED